MSDTVHYLLGGLPLCRFSMAAPKDWPPGHTWVRIWDPDPTWRLKTEKYGIPGNTLCQKCVEVKKQKNLDAGS